MRFAVLFPLLLLAGLGAWALLRDRGGADPREVDRAPGLVRETVGDGGAAEESAPAPIDPARERALDANDEGLALLEAGDAVAAVAAFERARQELPEDAVLARNLSRARLEAGSQAYRSGRLSDAEAWFRQAREAHDDDGAPDWWLARLRLQQGKRAEAAEILDVALQSFPDSAALLRLRADLEWLAGDLDAALRDLDAALALLPEDEVLLARRRQLEEEKRALAGFLTDSTTHFDCRYDPADVDLSAAMPGLRADLEAAYLDVVTVLGIRPEQRLLVLFLDPERYGGSAPAWSAGLYDGRVRVLVRDPETQREALRATLRHELTHAVLHTLGSGIPTWLHEGLAQQLEGADPQRARAMLRASGVRLQPAALEQDWTSWSDSGRVAEAYAYALSFATWLPERFGRSAIPNLLFALPGRGFEEAWRVAFARPWVEVEAEHRDALLAERDGNR